ncbi:MAG: DUF58 domain-containing protein [Lachnospiraceae bacterium]
MRRIRNLLRYIVIIGLNVFVMLAFHSYLNLVLLIGLILFPFYSIYGVCKVKQNLTLKISAPADAMARGETFYLYFVLDNPTLFPLVNVTLQVEAENAFYGEKGTHYLNLPVRAGKKTEVTYPVVMEFCGHFRVSVKQIRLMDLLGIYETTVSLQEEAECLVLPTGVERNKEAGEIYRKGVSEAMESREKGYDFSEISGIREYIPGDKLQNIHWKLSVKKDELMVKERVSVSAMQLNVLVDLENDDDMRLEGVLELADSVTRAFVIQNLPFTVHYYSTNLGALRECYIGSEIERQQWLEMLLYDTCYTDGLLVEEMFFKQNTSVGSYLYIGYSRSDEEQAEALVGDRQAIAILRK